MPSFRTAAVVALLDERPGLQRCEVAFTGEGSGAGVARSRAYVLVEVVGPVAVGDEVVLNTTAIELGLGSGGWHVVHWNLSRRSWQSPGPGHLMKLRYTSLQSDTGSAEELHAGQLAEADDLESMPVVVCSLHSQVPCVAAACKEARPELRLAYVMTDGGALPMATSELVPAMKAAGLVDVTITAGHAFGGDHEAINVPAALTVARVVEGAGVTVVGMGPGSAGTATRLGMSALEVAPALDAAESLGGRPVAAVRFSLADPRLRHQGASHHSRTALGLLTRARATIGVPRGPYAERLRADLERSGIAERHRLLSVDDADVPTLLAQRRLRVTSMRRGPEDDPAFYAVAGAGGTVAALLAR
ncbi:MAG TPA: DUF3866 family protein [Acidimicrobiales bacterium]|nr:DUF3866 family protein [Acidimicrobiales bacterium]